MTMNRDVIRAPSNPPTVLITKARRIRSTAAHKLLSDFVLAAESDPALHPDAILTERGPQFGAADGEGYGPTMYHLKRIAESLASGPGLEVGENEVVDEKYSRKKLNTKRHEVSKSMIAAAGE
ncbi:MAG: hypothetical protein M1825_000270 [Sarcosagium campestre]|nr:MAG: hypothetical protein M1825_000270 [Sarcosagium campestre]